MDGGQRFRPGALAVCEAGSFQPSASAQKSGGIGLARAVNPHHPEVWAQVAALAFFEEGTAGAEKALTEDRKFWRSNPDVSKAAGVTLAGQYRFAKAIKFLRS